MVKVTICDTEKQLASAAAARAAFELSYCITERAQARLLVDGVRSLFDAIGALVCAGEVAWSKTVVFQSAEYIGLPPWHPASLRCNLQEYLVGPAHPAEAHLIDGNAPLAWVECERLCQLIGTAGADLALLGMGHDGELGFNATPAELDTDVAFHVVDLPQSLRDHQVHEEGFRSLAEVPSKAITVTIHELLRSRCVVCAVPSASCAPAVKRLLSGPLDPDYPATALRKHPNAHLFLDGHSACLLDEKCLAQYRVVRNREMSAPTIGEPLHGLATAGKA